MCGIGGYVDPQGALDGPAVLSVLASALAHRGPDGERLLREGPFGLAHRRLAIIDLSEGGAQPMRVGPIVVVFNGEIYNYRELREELRHAGQQFTGVSDTEVLARAYLQWGAECVARLRGMWAFVIADTRSQTLLCARDPFGIKPLYYAFLRGAFVFASEPQALVRIGVPARVNLRRAAQYLALGVTDHDSESFFEGIVQLKAGGLLTVDATARVQPLVSAEPGLADGRGTASVEEFATCLHDSVRLHLRSDVPVGTCLSGGLDSSTVAALAAAEVRAAHGPRFAAVTAASGEARTDERRYAAAVVEHCDLAWHVVTPSAKQFAREIDDCLRAQGEPAVSPSVYFQYCVMRGARAAGVKVMLDGQGADELLCGYERYAPIWALEVARSRGLLVSLGEFMRVARHSRPGVRGMTALAAYMLLPRLRRRHVMRRSAFLRAEFLPCVHELLARLASAARNVHDARLADIAEFSLPALLRYEDRNSMAHSIEARVPYVDRAVAAAALRMPTAQLLHAGFTKYPLRLLAAKLLPASIAWRRSKIGFEPPTGPWLAALGERMDQQVSGSTVLARLCIDRTQLRRLSLAQQWRLYNLARWQQLFAAEVS
jgi:asparagine synthase (glutamine-hydrolysing)